MTTSGLLLETRRAETGRPDLELDGAPTLLTGGLGAELLRFRLLDPPPNLSGDLVARIVPTRSVGRWEATIQRSVAEQRFPTPAVRLSVDETSPLGRFLIVMDAVDGRPPMDGLGAGELLVRLPTLTRDLPDLLAGVAADLHSLDPEPLAARLALLDEPLPLTAAGFVGENGRLAAGIGRRDLVGAAERLLAAEPAAEGRVVAHGDFHPLNVLMAPTGPVLIDWTLARVTDPAFTLGFTVLVLAEPPISLPGPGAAVLRRVGARLVERFLRSYRRRTDGTSAEVGDTQLRWHRDVHALRILVESAVLQARGDAISGGHPWALLEPVARRLLGLRQAPLTG